MTEEKIMNALVLPIQDAMLLPGVRVQVALSRQDGPWRQALENSGDAVSVALPLKVRKARGAKIAQDDLHMMGVSFRDFNIKETERGALLSFRAEDRVKAEDLREENGLFRADIVAAPEKYDLDDRMQEQLLHYIRETVDDISAKFQGGEEFSRIVAGIDDVNIMIAWLARYMTINEETRYELLKTDSLRERSLKFLDSLLKQKETVDWNIELNERIAEKNNRAYREQVLKEQLQAIEEELGETSPEQRRMNEYKKQIAEKHLPEEVRKAAEEELEKLTMEQRGSAETSVIRNYLDFILALPWEKEVPAPFSLAKAREILESRHYGLKKIKRRILQHLAVMQLKKDKKGSILLFVGPPGTGKTSLGKSIAEALGREYVRMSLGGVRDEAEIRGHRRTYVGAMAGRILGAMKKAGKTNPVIVLDEVDKLMTGGFSGDPASALLEVLDPEQNDTFTDHYLDLPYDLSDVFFIATANSLDTVPAPLLDRMEVIEVSGYTPDEKMHIAKEHLLPATLEEHGLTSESMQIGDDIMEKIIADYTREAGVRGLKKKLDALAREASEKIVGGEKDLPWKPTEADLEDALGHRVARHELAGEINPPGVVTGLAWTPVGGEILFIEATEMKGGGEVILTGQLGDVMKESARISLSLLRSRLPLDALDFKARDIHIHVPSGATPKDGPSAGIALFTALASLMTGKRVDPKLAMTGEITLRGLVMPIGGLKEKLLGAQRAGINRVLIPEENVEDLKDVPEDVQTSIKIVPVKTIEDVLREALGINVPKLGELLFAKGDEMARAKA